MQKPAIYFEIRDDLACCTISLFGRHVATLNATDNVTWEEFVISCGGLALSAGAEIRRVR